MALAGVNPIDTILRSGQMKEWQPVQFPGVLGRDVSGTVERLGAGVTGFSLAACGRNGRFGKCGDRLRISAR